MKIGKLMGKANSRLFKKTDSVSVNKTDMHSLCEYAKQFSGMNEDKMRLLHSHHQQISSLLPGITDALYSHLAQINKVHPLPQRQLKSLIDIHHEWLTDLFISDYGDEYTEKLHQVGATHVKMKLPFEFISGATTTIQSKLIQICNGLYPQGGIELMVVNDAINSATGFSLQVMQTSYQSSALAKELEQFLLITGMSRALFDNMARAYR